MSGRDIIEDHLDMLGKRFSKLREKQMDEDIKDKVSNYIYKYVPVASKQDPAELESFTDNLVRQEGFLDKSIIKQAINKLITDDKISHTRGKDRKIYFIRYK